MWGIPVKRPPPSAKRAPRSVLADFEVSSGWFWLGQWPILNTTKSVAPISKLRLNRNYALDKVAASRACVNSGA